MSRRTPASTPISTNTSRYSTPFATTTSTFLPSATKSKTQTPRTSRAGTYISDGASRFITAIVESRGVAREIGIAAWEQDTGNVYLTQFADSQTYAKTVFALNKRPPSTILIPATVSGNQTQFPGTSDQQDGSSISSILAQCLNFLFHDSETVGMARRLWDSQKGYEAVSKFNSNGEESLATLNAIQPKFYSLCAVSCLFEYIEANMKISFSPQSLFIRYVALQGTLFMDYESIIHLELVSNRVSKSSKHTLFGLLNKTFTPGGARLLRSNILSPVTDLSTIESRLDAISWLVTSEEGFAHVNDALSKLKNKDFESLIGSLVASNPENKVPKNRDISKEAERKIELLVQISVLLSVIPNIKQSIQHSESPLLKTIYGFLDSSSLDTVDNHIKDTIDEEIVNGNNNNINKSGMMAKNTKVYAVKSNRKLLLEVTRKIYNENVEDIYEYVEGLNSQYKLSIDAAFTKDSFELVFPDPGGNIPDEFINVRRKSGKIRCLTLDLKKRNQRLSENLMEIFSLSDEVLSSTIKDIQDDIIVLYKCSEAIALLDMLSSLAKVAIYNKYIRPEFSDVIAIKSGRHPIQEQMKSLGREFVPNDCYCSEMSSFQIITGPNMSGKSTYIRQIAVLLIMAQVGSFVPAEYASFKIHDALLSRLSNDDDIEGNLSTFTREMSQMSTIIGALHSFSRCFVIIDELGRGTSPHDGVAIAHALSEEIIKKKAFCLFSTHYALLTKTLGAYPNVVSLRMSTQADIEYEGALIFEHRIVDLHSVETQEHMNYGIQIASLQQKLPPEVITTARQVVNEIQRNDAENEQNSKEVHVTKLRKEILKLAFTLGQIAKENQLSDSELKKLLQSLQNDAIQTLNENIQS